MPTSATNELGKHPSRKVKTELLDYQQRKGKLEVGLWKTSQKLWGEILPLTETMDLDWYEQGDEKLISPGG